METDTENIADSPRVATRWRSSHGELVRPGVFTSTTRPAHNLLISRATMALEHDPILETVLTVTDAKGQTFTLVTFADGSYGLAQGGEPIDGHRWSNGQMKECVDALVRLAGLDRLGE